MCREAARRFAGLPHRCQWVAGRNGVSWYNDSKATNVGATVAAIGGMTGQVVAVLFFALAYLAAITSSGRGGGGGVLSQSRASR